jgi:hypothetical protein
VLELGPLIESPP